MSQGVEVEKLAVKATSPLKRPSLFPLFFNDCGVVVFLEEVTGKEEGGD